MTKRLQSLKGMPDILPKETPLWHQFESSWKAIMHAYCYQEIRSPVLEMTSLFKRSIGEVTDIVEKEMFTFQDRDGESITLRPEATAGCVRAGVEHGLLHNQIQRLWYMGPMFRYEKPQQGRFRQFTQAGAEAFGLFGPDIEVEQIMMLDRLWRVLGIKDSVVLQINTLGSKDARDHYREKLVAYFSKFYNVLDEDSQRRLKTNPLRILDSKNPALKNILEEAPRSYDYLNPEDKKHFEVFQQYLTEAAVKFEINPRIVRGLDYYNRTVYEWVTDKLGAQPALAAGGRYDGLVEQLGGKSTPGVGFALGIERVILLRQILDKIEDTQPEVYFIVVGERAKRKAFKTIEFLRDQCPHLQFLLNCGEGDFKTQFKRADKIGAKIALVLSDNEVETQSLSIKFLREDKPQISLKETEIGQFLSRYFENNGRKQ